MEFSRNKYKMKEGDLLTIVAQFIPGYGYASDRYLINFTNKEGILELEIESEDFLDMILEAIIQIQNIIDNDNNKIQTYLIEQENEF